MKARNTSLQHSQRRLLAFLCTVLALLQILDLHSTLLAMQAGRSEANPVIFWLIGHIGAMPAVAAFKAAALGVLVGYYLVVSRFRRMLWPSISLIPVCAAYVAVVLNNYS
jgi:hypothetical protein